MLGKDREQLGIVPVQEALQQAQSAGLDLVEISPNANPPVCRLMDYGKYVYEQKAKSKENKKKQHVVHIKELKYRPGIGEGDYQVKLKCLIKFLEKGDKVKVTMRYRGREVTHHEIGTELLNRIEKDCIEYGVVEQTPRFEGRQVVMVLAPKK